MDETEWVQTKIATFEAEYGAVPPPWFVFPNTHPYSIGWRMGAGESHIIIFAAWWSAQKWDEAQRLTYFRRWPPPPRWLKWFIHTLWDVNPWELEEEESLDYTPYFARCAELGFGTQAQFEQDLDDPQWLNA